MEFTADKVLDSIATGQSRKIVVGFKKLFPSSNETTLKKLTDKQFCPYRCTIYPDETPDETADLCNFHGLRSIPMTLSKLWGSISRHLWTSQVFYIVLFLIGVGTVALVVYLREAVDLGGVNQDSMRATNTEHTTRARAADFATSAV
jgi:hypothetical protein